MIGAVTIERQLFTMICAVVVAAMYDLTAALAIVLIAR